MPSTACPSVRRCPRWLTTCVAVLAIVNGILVLLGCVRVEPNNGTRVPIGTTKVQGNTTDPGTPAPKSEPVVVPAENNTPVPNSAPVVVPARENPPVPNSAPKVDPTGTPSVRRVALLVGIAKYDSEVGDLLYPENDVNALAEVLKGGGYKPEDVIVMTSSAKDESLKPYAANITAKLNALLAGLKKEDLVMVALAGHGVQPAGDKAYFCGYKAKLGDPSTLVPVDSLIEAMNRSPATTKIILVDACRDSPGSRAPKLREPAPVDLPSVTGRDGTATIAYFSCSENEKSWEVDELQHGVFFAQIIDGLAGGADMRKDGLITWSLMEDHVQRNLNYYNARYRGRKQTPHFRGEVRNAAPIVVRPGSGSGDLLRVGPATGDAVNEDFRAVATGGLPRGWEGPAFTRTYDEKASRPCVELRRKEGLHSLVVPLAKPLAGDFAVEIEFLMGGLTWDSRDFGQEIWLSLEGENGQVVPVIINYQGAVSFANAATRATERFKRNEINRLRLVRTGDSYRLDLNDGDAASDKIPYTGQINGIQLSVLHHWVGAPGHGPNFTTRFYSVKAGSTTPGDLARVGSVTMNENIHSRERGAFLPPGWVGDGFSIATDSRYDLRALEVNKAEAKVFWVKVPKVEATLGRGRPFILELDVRLCTDWGGPDGRYDGNRPPGQEMYLRLEGPNSLPLTVVLDPYGRVRIGGEKEAHAKWFARHQTNRLRLVHVKGVYQVLVNGVQVTSTNGPPGNYTEFAIGLVGGTPDVAHAFPAKLYSVKLTALPGGEVPTPSFRGVVEDFGTTPVGRGPATWEGRNLGCRYGWGRPGNLIGSPAVELIDLAQPGNAVVPNLRLDGDFAAAIEFSHHEDNHKDTIGFGLYGAAKTAVLEVLLFHNDEKYWIQVKNGTTKYTPVNVSSIFAAQKPNSVSLVRKGGGIGIVLNDKPVGTPIPVGKTPATYENFQIQLSTTAKTSPRLTGVRVFSQVTQLETRGP